VFLGGQISSDARGTVLHAGDLPAQFARAVGNVATALAAAGCRPADVVKLTYYVTDVAVYRAALGPIGAAYREVFGTHYPATSLFEVKGLFEPEALIEIEAIALLPDHVPTQSAKEEK
jgi:enamine deaminase RidA (YjgF/YER057c/UK114 family)